MASLLAGAASCDITPKNSVFLFGYPNVPRWSTGVHDPLLASALYLHDGERPLLLLTCDLIFVSKESATRIRQALGQRLGIAAQNILVAATHTHSGPLTMECVASRDDPVVPATDPAYVLQMEEGLIAAGLAAAAKAQPAELGMAVADGSGVGGNRREPGGPADPQTPVLLLRGRDNGKPIALAMVYSMHPTVLHEDSTLISGDFPAFTRQLLSQCLGGDCTVLYFSGPAGNQSPRHFIKSTTFAEAQRLGETLAHRVLAVLPETRFQSQVSLHGSQQWVELPLRHLPDVPQAQVREEQVRQTLQQLRDAHAPRAQVRTAECDWFGAQMALLLAKAAAQGRLHEAARRCMPAEVQTLAIGPWSFVGWPGEIFIEYALALKSRRPNTFIINYANGETQGYLVTAAAVAEGGYEASNAIFASPESGDLLLQAALDATTLPAALR